MLNDSNYSFCEEFYFIEKSIEIVVTLKSNDDPSRIRIDALHSPVNPNLVYSTRSYIEEELTIQPTYPQVNGEFTRKPIRTRMWIDYDLPWTNGKSSEEVLAQALSFLHERCM